MKAAIHSSHYPNVNAIARQLSGGNTVVYQQYTQYAIECLKPGIDYFSAVLAGPLQACMAAFKAARLFLPWFFGCRVSNVMLNNMMKLCFSMSIMVYS